MSKPILINQFNGLSDSKWSGIKGSLYKQVGLDIHSQPGSITVHQKLALDSGSTVTEFCRVSLSCSNGYQFWFSYTSGKIWARAAAGTWTLAYTTVPSAGNAGTLGAFEYNGFVFWATQSRLHRITIANADDSWASVSLDWNTFGVTDANYHLMTEVNGTLFIGDGYQVASVNSSSTFTANALNIITPLIIKCLYPFNIDLIIGTIITSSVNRCQIIRWDTVQTTWQYAEWIEENGINSFLQTTEALLAQVGQAGNWYYYDGQTLKPYKRIPGTWTPTKYGEVYPGSVANFRGFPIFGFSNSPDAANSTGNPADQGIYTFGNYSKDYPRVISGPDWIISQDKVATIEIGAILVEKNDLYVAWKDGSNFGVDKLDWSNKYGSAYLETMIIQADTEEQALTAFNRFFANYNSMPSGTSLTFSYSKNGGAYLSKTTILDTEMNQQYVKDTVSARTIQMKVAFNVSLNSAPLVEAIGIENIN